MPLPRSKRPSPTANDAAPNATAPRPRTPSSIFHQAATKSLAQSVFTSAPRSLAMPMIPPPSSPLAASSGLASCPQTYTLTAAATGRTETRLSGTSTRHASTARSGTSNLTSERHQRMPTLLRFIIRWRRLRHLRMSSSLPTRQRYVGQSTLANANFQSSFLAIMSKDSFADGRQTQQGIFAENGSGGVMSDLTFTGGNFGICTSL